MLLMPIFNPQRRLLLVKRSSTKRLRSSKRLRASSYSLRLLHPPRAQPTSSPPSISAAYVLSVLRLQHCRSPSCQSPSVGMAFRSEEALLGQRLWLPFWHGDPAGNKVEQQCSIAVLQGKEKHTRGEMGVVPGTQSSLFAIRARESMTLDGLSCQQPKHQRRPLWPK